MTCQGVIGIEGNRVIGNLTNNNRNRLRVTIFMHIQGHSFFEGNIIRNICPVQRKNHFFMSRAVGVFNRNIHLF